MKRQLAFESCEGRLMFAGLNDVDTPADVIHPNIHDKVGKANGNANANPNGNGNGGQVHGIGNTYGQGGEHPRTGEPGFKDQLGNVHGGINELPGFGGDGA